jgi:hypothetical protein
MLGAEVVVAEAHGFLLSKDHGHTSPFGIWFEHRRGLLSDESNSSGGWKDT